MADFATALEFLDTQSYRKKNIGGDGEPYYEPYGVCDDLSNLKEYGLGIYLYLELIKRLFIAFLVITALVAAPLALNFDGNGLSTYT